MTIVIDHKLLAILQGEDELGVVIRAHMIIEKQLVEFNKLHVISPSYLENATPNYNNICNLAFAFGLGNIFKGPLQNLGKIRNHFAHSHDMSLEKEQVDSFYSSFSQDDKKAMAEAYKTTKQNHGETSVLFKDASPRDRFIILVITLHAALLVAVDEVFSRMAHPVS